MTIHYIDPAPPAGMRYCDATVNLRSPIRSERVRDFQPPWRTIYVYSCPQCGTERRVRANSFTGGKATPGVGAIRCGALLVK